MRPRTEGHDLDVKVRSARKFLTDGQKVKISVFFRGREITHPEFGGALLRRVAESLEEAAKLEKAPAMEGRAMTMILAPLPVKIPVKKVVAEPVEEKVSAEA